MSSEEYPDYSKTFSLEKTIAQAKWFHEDLEKGAWRIVQDEDKSKCWIKTFPNENVPVKVLFKCDVALSVQQFIEASDSRNMDQRTKWDTNFSDQEVLEEYPDGGGYVVYYVTKLPWPLTDREFVLFTTTAKEIEWNGKQAYIIPYIDASHKSKPANVGPYVRATNGGQFTLVMEDEDDPGRCKLFCLSHNLYNGWIPNSHIEFLVGPSARKAFNTFFGDMAKGYKLYFSDNK